MSIPSEVLIAQNCPPLYGFQSPSAGHEHSILLRYEVYAPGHALRFNPLQRGMSIPSKLVRIRNGLLRCRFQSPSAGHEHSIYGITEDTSSVTMFQSPSAGHEHSIYQPLSDPTAGLFRFNPLQRGMSIPSWFRLVWVEHRWEVSIPFSGA